MIRLFIKKCVLFLGLTLAMAGLALGEGIAMRLFTVGNRTIGWFANGTGQAVTGLQIGFDRPVALVGKLEIGGGFQNVTGTDTAAEFLFQGSLAKMGFVELSWEPVEAKPILVMWLVGERPVGRPYFGTVPVLVKLLSSGLAQMRDANPEAFTTLLATFFTVNPTLADSLARLGLTPQALTGMLMVAPAEGIENLLLTLVSSFGLTTLEDFMGALDWSLIFEALGL
ncbi:MAG TPA: hypothetical protein ENN53_06045 [Candidatus Acetothermia bacterium]|nr:hypothetical protein [Candidatus Acetothermia bacterium]